MKTKLLIPVVFCLITITACKTNSQVTSLQKSPEEIAGLIIKDLLSRPDFMIYRTPGVTALHYAEVCCAYGSLKFSGNVQDSLTLNKVIARYEKATPEFIPNTENHVDANVYGILPLEIYMHTKNKDYLNKGLYYAGGQWKDTLPGGFTSQTRYWIDDIYMIGCLQVQAYRATGDNIYLDRVALEIHSYIEKLQQEDGLFFHGPDAPIYWGRGNGWVAAGLAEVISVLPETNPYYPSILAGYKKMMETLLKNQSKDGMWHQVINKPESFKETSSTAMFGFAMAMGVKNGILPKKPFQAAYIKAWNALIEYIDEDGKIGEVCVGTGQSQDIQYYYNRPRIKGDFHGQAAMIWFASTLVSNRE